VDLIHRLVLVCELDGRAAVTDEARRKGWTVPAQFTLEPAGARDFIGINILDLAPADAIKHFSSKVPLTADELKKLDASAKAKAFSIAGDVTQQFVADVMAARVKAFEQGSTLAAFIETVRGLYDDHGYTPASPFYLETVYRNTAAEAFNGARWQQMTDPDLGDFYWGFEYVTVGDDRVRPAHAALSGYVAPKSDAVWSEIWPPNGDRCRCSTRGVTQADAKRRGLTGASPYPPGFRPDPGWDHNPGQQL